MLIASVIVDVPAKAVDRPYDYHIPERFDDVLDIGMRVVVPFGNRKVMGFCVGKKKTSEITKGLKDIAGLLDMESYLTEELIDLSHRLKEQTASLQIKIIQAMLPSALRASYETGYLKAGEDNHIPDDIKRLFGKHDVFVPKDEQAMQRIKKALKNGYVKPKVMVHSRNKPATLKTIAFEREADDKSLTKKQRLVFDHVKENKEVFLQETLDKMDVSRSVVDALEKKDLISFGEKEKYREPSPPDIPPDKTITLNEEQQEAYEKIIKNLNQNVRYLLHGITGSGKTEIYLKVIERVLKAKKETIFLVPEIALTPMMVNRFKAKFGDKVAILHSGLSQGEKFDEWRKIVRGEVQIAIGARSACFAPFENLGLAIVDECHETTYKQEDNPNYYAIDILNKRAKSHQMPVVLGSATPNIESFAKAKRGHYVYLPLKKRAQNALLPTIETVDMRKEFKARGNTVLSEYLRSAIEERLIKNEQTILLLNRRGYANFMICRNCGYVFKCPNCDVSLTYHHHDQTLKCHYCSHKEPVPKKCPYCDSKSLRMMGSGTQRLEETLHKLFPDATIVRMDNDTTRKKNAHRKLLGTFERDGDILLGTQMIAKGLDFPKVTLVGILQADGSLFQGDFRAPEKTFQLIMQVSGRSGRHELAGHVIIQAFNPEHYAIDYALHQDYEGFYEHEMRLRRKARYVPFYYMVEIRLTHSNVRDLWLFGKSAVDILRKTLSESAIVLGPAMPVISKINNRYLCKITVKYQHEDHLFEALTKVRRSADDNDVYVTIDNTPMLG